jgi:hypothetical protein
VIEKVHRTWRWIRGMGNIALIATTYLPGPVIDGTAGTVGRRAEASQTDTGEIGGVYQGTQCWQSWLNPYRHQTKWSQSYKLDHKFSGDHDSEHYSTICFVFLSSLMFCALLWSFVVKVPVCLGQKNSFTKLFIRKQFWWLFYILFFPRFSPYSAIISFVKLNKYR